MTRSTLFSIFLLTLSLFAAAGCTYKDFGNRQEIAKRIAMPAFMLPRDIETDHFFLKAYERVYAEGKTANLYIEGDGLVWMGHKTPQFNPTPVNPVALHLASRDNSPNVLYLARPCQYVGLENEPNCNELIWTIDRYSEEIVRNMNQAIDNMKRHHDITGFNLIGYAGGGAIATLVAAKRDDVLSIRTVAGILDHDAWTHMRDMEPLVNSLNAVYVASQIADIPQHHFIGDIDYSVTPDIYWRYYEAGGHSPCMRATIVKNEDHESGWVDRWPSLMKEKLDCTPTTPSYSSYAP